MKAALLYGLQDLRIVDIPSPKVRPRTVLLQVNACGICPTDIKKFNTIYSGELDLPTNLGHEFVGTVLEIGSDVDGFQEGMRVMGDGFGGYAEYALLDLDLKPPVHIPQPLLIPENVSDAAATFVEPLGCCIHAVKDQANIQKDQTVLIIGGGTMGQLLLMVAKSVGSRVILSEPYKPRRDTALSLGADAVIDPQKEDVRKAVRHLNNNDLVDVTILTVGNPKTVPVAMETVHPCGSVLLFGRFPHGVKLKIDPLIIYRNEVKLLGSYWVGGGPNCANTRAFFEAIKLIEDKQVPVERIISETYSLMEFHKAFAAAASMDTFKIIIKP